MKDELLQLAQGNKKLQKKKQKKKQLKLLEQYKSEVEKERDLKQQREEAER
jgi:hypothetical protein